MNLQSVIRGGPCHPCAKQFGHSCLKVATAVISPGSGTIPLVILATRSDKVDPTGTETDGIAKYTKAANAGTVVSVTSQRELTQFFGNPVFESTEAAETSEYGLLAAYSFLGQGSQLYAVRAQ